MSRPLPQLGWVRLLFLVFLGVAAFPAVLSGAAGWVLGAGVLHPANLHAMRTAQLDGVLQRTAASMEDFNVTAPDGVALRGWKFRPASPNGDWMLVLHGVSDNRSGQLAHAEFLLRHGYGVVAMDARAHGESGGDIATYGWKERYDTVAIVDALCKQEKVRHLGALGVSMGAAIALQSAAVEPRIEAVIAEDPFENLREVSYDYAGLHFSPLLGKTLLRPATIFAMKSMARAGGFSPDDVSPAKAVAARAFPVLLICGSQDQTIPCRHAEAIFAAARGPKELWEVPGARHAAALGQAPAVYEDRSIQFLQRSFSAN